MTVTHVDAARLHDAAFRRDPIPVWRALRDAAPVFHDTVDNVWLLTRHADVAEAFDDRVHLSNRLYRRTLGVVFGPNLLQMDGAEHLRRRALVGPMLVGERLRTYVPLVEDVAAGIARDLEGREEIDLVKDVTNHLPGAVIMAILGLPREDHPVVFPWYEAMMAGLWEDDDLRARGAEAHRAFAEYLRPLLDARRRSPGDDLLSRLVTSELPDEEIPAFASLLLTAGGETTDKALANLWAALLQDPDLLRAVRADPTVLDAAFSETLRAYPPLVYLGREVAAPRTWHGVEVPVGAQVRLCVGSANRDERVFAQPDEFVVPRHDLLLGRERRTAPTVDGRASYVSFGVGRHFCIGYELARLEALTMSRHLLATLTEPELTASVEMVVTGPARSVPSLPIRRRL